MHPERRKLNIGIIGTRGIPNQYGGFEQFAEKFALLFAERGHKVTVYCSSRHAYKDLSYRGISLIHCFDPEDKIGTAGQFIYDLFCILDSRKRRFDIILQLGYTSSTVWSWLFPEVSLIVTNMDGLEWQRSKYRKAVQRFLRLAEKWAVRYSDYLIADSQVIQDYLQKKYKAPSQFIPYGAIPVEAAAVDIQKIKELGLLPYQYDLMIARFEPENNVDMVMRCYSRTGRPLVAIGNFSSTSLGRSLYKQYNKNAHIIFRGATFDDDTLNALRYYARLYLHGHSVGGTNPSLLEAMAGNAVIAAHDNPFNRAVLEEHAFYFKNERDLSGIISGDLDRDNYTSWLRENRMKIDTLYNWERIANVYETLCYKWLSDYDEK